MSAGESKKRGFGDIVAVWALETRNVLGSDHLSLPSQDSGGAAGQGEEEEEDKEHKSAGRSEDEDGNDREARQRKLNYSTKVFEGVPIIVKGDC